jgi:hypothetical protein
MYLFAVWVAGEHALCYLCLGSLFVAALRVDVERVLLWLVVLGLYFGLRLMGWRLHLTIGFV